jgi:hypothetical protein
MAPRFDSRRRKMALAEEHAQAARLSTFSLFRQM